MAPSTIFKVCVFEGTSGDWFYEAKARNGRVLSVSEGYKRRGMAIRCAARAYPDARLVVEESEDRAA